MKMEYRKTKRKPMVVPYDTCPVALQCTTSEKIQVFRQALVHKRDDRTIICSSRIRINTVKNESVDLGYLSCTT